MPFDAADIAAFNDADMPAYASATLGAVTVGGRFRARYAELLGVSGNSPVFAAATDDLATAAVGGAITIDGTAYTITAIEPDSLGQTVLRLNRA